MFGHELLKFRMVVNNVKNLASVVSAENKYEQRLIKLLTVS